jgi:hypothetical protein
MGRVFQPEVIAQAVLDAALDRPREYWIGLSTLKVILANMVLPGWLDRYLARTAIGGQQTKLPLQPGRRDNLIAPVYELHRTRGSFGREASESAVVFAAGIARAIPVVIGAAALFGLGLLASRAVTDEAGRTHHGPPSRPIRA